jgi:8-amino-7-oxononanoate synthase
VKHLDPLLHLRERLADLEREGLLRTRPSPLPRGEVSFCSNDYLGLADETPEHALLETTPSGAGASRLVAGERREHVELEATVARWLGTESALAFTSGYAANLGALSALAGPGDVIVSDALNHASIIDGARLSRATVEILPHLDLAALEAVLAKHARGRPSARQIWVATESYFSMDADTPDLVRVRALATEFGAGLLVDEAHALGVMGPNGAGLLAASGVRAEAIVGTFGKSFGHAGAFVAGSHELVSWLWNRARSFVFSTGLSPVVAVGARRAIERAAADPALRERTLTGSAELRRQLAAALPAARILGYGHIVPILVGDPRRAVEVAAAVRRDGVHVQAIRPPTVPEGTARLRLSWTARHSGVDVERAVDALARALSAGPATEAAPR